MDRIIVAALADRQRFRTLRAVVPADMIDPSTSAMLEWFAVYFDAFPEHSHVDPDALDRLVRLRTADSDPESVALLLQLIRALKKPIDPSTINGIVGQLHELDLAGRSAALIRKYEAGGEVDLAFELAKLSTDTLRGLGQLRADDWTPPDIGQILATLGDDSGLKFRFLDALKSNIRGLLPGDSLLFGARVDSGKSSFLCRAAVDFAAQCAERKDSRPILFLNNESVSDRLWPRLYSAALGIGIPEMVKLHKAGKLERKFQDAIGGQRIIMRDVHGANLAKVDALVQQYEPAVLLLDMPANLKMGQGERKTDALEELWQGLRATAAIHSLVHIGSCQISAEGKDTLYPDMSALKDSKTGVQGAVDAIIMMGALHDQGAADLRGFSTPKNKLALPGRPSRVRAEVHFDGATCQFNDYGE